MCFHLPRPNIIRIPITNVFSFDLAVFVFRENTLGEILRFREIVFDFSVSAAPTGHGELEHASFTALLGTHLITELLPKGQQHGDHVKHSRVEQTSLKPANWC